MNTPWLESRLASNPNSPFFARLASEYLKEGQTQRAIELCIAGLKVFPEYATAHLVLGKCYEASDRNVEAMLEYRKAFREVPDNPAVKALLISVERREQDAFKEFAEERARKLKERKESLSLDGYLAQDKESTVDFVLRRLSEAKKPAPVQDTPAPKEDDAEHPSLGATKIVTATLAEIYASQGEYSEAIEAYRKLLAQRPLDAKRYEKRITQLEQLAKLQQTDK